MRLRFSANAGFLWRDLPFVARIRRAAAAGFDAVEFHDEAQTADPVELAEALAETGLPVCSLNVRMGATAGCAAVPGQGDQARRDIDAAARTAQAAGAAAIHVLAGVVGAAGDRAAYLAALRHALARTDRIVLIEPICRAAVPGYFLHDVAEAAAILDEIGHPRLKLLFDCFHVETESGDAAALFRRHVAAVGHVQIASVPERAEPGTARPDYARLLPMMQAAGYRGAFGCEYRPAAGDGAAGVEAGLGWRQQMPGAAGG